MQIILEIDENDFKESIINDIANGLSLSDEEKDKWRNNYLSDMSQFLEATKDYIEDKLFDVLHEELITAETTIADSFVEKILANQNKEVNHA